MTKKRNLNLEYASESHRSILKDHGIIQSSGPFRIELCLAIYLFSDLKKVDTIMRSSLDMH